MATKIICETLGCNSDAKSIQTAINNASPEQLLQLKQAEKDFEIRMKELDVDVFKLEAEDKKDARGSLVKIGQLELWVLQLSVFLDIYF